VNLWTQRKRLAALRQSGIARERAGNIEEYYWRITEARICADQGVMTGEYVFAEANRECEDQRGTDRDLVKETLGS